MAMALYFDSKPVSDGDPKAWPWGTRFQGNVRAPYPLGVWADFNPVGRGFFCAASRVGDKRFGVTTGFDRGAATPGFALGV